MRTLRPLALTCLLALAAGLAACQGSQAPDGQQSTAAGDTTVTANGPDAKPGMSAQGARLVLPAMTGRPGVAYFTLKNGGAASATLAAVEIKDVGRAEMHRTAGGKMEPVDKVDVAPGATVAFAPGGLHVMAFDVADTLKPGSETEITLTFSDGDKLSTPARIEAFGAGAQH